MSEIDPVSNIFDRLQEMTEGITDAVSDNLPVLRGFGGSASADVVPQMGRALDFIEPRTWGGDYAGPRALPGPGYGTEITDGVSLWDELAQKDPANAYGNDSFTGQSYDTTGEGGYSEGSDYSNTTSSERTTHTRTSTSSSTYRRSVTSAWSRAAREGYPLPLTVEDKNGRSVLFGFPTIGYILFEREKESGEMVEGVTEETVEQVQRRVTEEEVVWLHKTLGKILLAQKQGVKIDQNVDNMVSQSTNDPSYEAVEQAASLLESTQSPDAVAQAQEVLTGEIVSEGMPNPLSQDQTILENLGFSDARVLTASDEGIRLGDFMGGGQTEGTGMFQGALPAQAEGVTTALGDFLDMLSLNPMEHVRNT